VIENASEELKGTPAELVKRGVRLNGWPLAVSDFAGLRKFHFKTAIEAAGYVQKVPGTKGKSAEIVQLIPAQGFQFSLPA
jgi:tRNA U34 5-carboxymethylaminomethyl modifying GTPase MnmE/TrmE